MSATNPVETHRSQMMKAAGLVATAVLLSRIIGLLRDIVTKYYLGVATIEATAFATASRFPETIFLIVAGGAIGSAFIPTFTAYFAREDESGAWRLFSAVINLAILITTLIAGLTILFAPQFVSLFFQDLINQEPQLLPLTVRLMRIMLISPVIFGASGVIMGALNARQHFLLPALAPTIYNLGIIAGALLINPKELGLAIGTVVGAVGHLLIQLPGLRWKGARYSAVLSLQDSGLRQVLRLMAPRVLGLSFSEINRFVILYLTGFMSLGAYPALDLALRVVILPQGVLGQAMGIAAFPTFAALAAQSALEEMRHILADSLRWLLFLGLPISAVLAILRQPMITLFFQRGRFNAEDTLLVAYALFFLALGLVALNALEIVARAFYALSDTTTPVLAGAAQILFMAALSGWLSYSLFPSFGGLPLGGLALGYSLSNFFEVGLLLWLLRRKMGGIGETTLWDGVWRMGIATAGMAGGMEIVIGWLPETAVWQQLIGGGLAGGVIYLLLCWLLHVKEIPQLWALAQRVVHRFSKQFWG